MYYEAADFLETADQETLRVIARARELTREYYFTHYNDTQKGQASSRSYWAVWVRMYPSMRHFIATTVRMSFWVVM